MTNIEIGIAIGVASVVVALGGVVASILLHRSDVRRSGREASDARINSVVLRYIESLKYGSGPMAFVLAGVKNLQTSEEIREAVRRIEGSVDSNAHPLGGKRRRSIMEYDDLLGLFHSLDANALNWNEVLDERGVALDG